MLKQLFNNEFEKTFRGDIILTEKTEAKLIKKHKVYKDDLTDAIADPWRVIMRPKKKSVIPRNKFKSEGKLYEILCKTSFNRILMIIGRLFQDGNLYIITSYWASHQLQHLYLKECEIPFGQEA